MNTSNETNELFAALAKATLETEPAVFDKTNTGVGSRYASLNSITASYKDAFARHGLTLTQDIKTATDNGTAFVGCVSRLSHSSGQWMEGSELWLPVVPIVSKADKAAGIIPTITAQAVAMAITYARRYSQSALLNLTSEEDDDGEATKGTGTVTRVTPPPTLAEQQAEAAKKSPPATQPVAPPVQKPPEPEAKTEAEMKLQVARSAWREAFNKLPADKKAFVKNSAEMGAKATDDAPVVTAKTIKLNQYLSSLGIS